MTSGMRASRQSASSAAPCSRRSAAFADLLRYCKIRAPPASALRTLRASNPMSGSSGVTAYRPRNPACETTQCSGFACAWLIHFPRPEKPVRYVLTHAWTKPRVKRLPRVFLGFAHRLGQLEAVGERRRDRCRKGATGSVITSRQSFPAVRAHYAFRAVERVHHLRRVLVRAGYEHVLAAQAEEFLRSPGEGKLIVVLALALNEAASFTAVGGENGGLGQKQLAHRRNHVLGRKLVAASGGKYRVEDERHVGIVRHDLRDRRDVLDAADHSDLERGDRHVLEHQARLVHHPLWVDGLQVLDAGRVLDGDCRNYGERVTTHRGERQQIRLHSRAAGRICSGKRKHDGGKGRGGHEQRRTGGSWQAALRSGYDATAHCNPSQPNDGKARFQNLDVFDLRIHLRRSGRITGGRNPCGDALGGHPDELDLP